MLRSTVRYAAMGLLIAGVASVTLAAGLQFRFSGPAGYGVYIASTETGKIRYYAGFHD